MPGHTHMLERPTMNVATGRHAVNVLSCVSAHPENKKHSSHGHVYILFCQDMSGRVKGQDVLNQIKG